MTWCKWWVQNSNVGAVTAFIFQLTAKVLAFQARVQACHLNQIRTNRLYEIMILPWSRPCTIYAVPDAEKINR
jgi:hypothetical protein